MNGKSYSALREGRTGASVCQTSTLLSTHLEHCVTLLLQSVPHACGASARRQHSGKGRWPCIHNSQLPSSQVEIPESHIMFLRVMTASATDSSSGECVSTTSPAIMLLTTSSGDLGPSNDDCVVVHHPNPGQPGASVVLSPPPKRAHALG